MSGHFWLKLYCEILDDLKMAHMTDHQYRRFIEFLLFAKEIDKGGSLGDIQDICWRLRISQEECETLLADFSKINIASLTDNGWKLTNFAKRQERSESAERVAKWRASHKNVPTVTEEVTSNVTVAPVPSTSTSTSLIKEDLNEDCKKVFTNYTDNFGALTPFIADSIKGAIDDYTASWVNDAMNEAVRNEARKWNYVEAILRRWKTDGFKSAKKGGNGRAQAPKPATTAIVQDPEWHP